VYIDGRFFPLPDATVSVYDHGLLYGDGVFEGIRAYGGSVFQLREHIERLQRSARSLRLRLPADARQFMDIVCELLRQNRLQDAYVRLIVTRGVGLIGPDPSACARPSVIVIAEPLPPVHGTDAADAGIAAAIVSIRRDPVHATSHEVKSLNYLNSVTARIQAGARGADDAIMLDARGLVCESSICNVFALIDGRLATPSTASGIVHGITRARIIELAATVGLPVEQRDITPYELLHADEIFLTGTHAEVVAVRSVDDLTIGDGTTGPWTHKLQAAFAQITTDPAYGTPLAQELG
jgi:branched-chain amino acid aminotransferase